MAMTRTHIKTTALQDKSPDECLFEVNRVLVRERVSSMFATCFYGVLNTRTGELRYCNAGHNPPYVLRASGALETFELAGGVPLGMLDGRPYKGGTVQLAQG